MTELLIRDGVAEVDAQSCADIYAPFVDSTAITFETEIPDSVDFARRINEAQRSHAWLVAEQDGEVVGYAYGVAFRSRPAYRFSTEVSIYLRQGYEGQGLGTRLYDELLERLTGLGYRMAVAGMVVPNPACEGLHRALGFEPVGVFRRVGWKQGEWRDVAWVQRPLGDDTSPPL